MDRDPALHAHVESAPVGILSRTLFQSPEVRRILTGRLRYAGKNDVVLVTSTGIHIKSPAQDHRFHTVASLNDLPRSIHDAVVVGKTHSPAAEDDRVQIKLEDGAVNGDDKSLADPPHVLVLLLDRDTLAFVSLKDKGADECELVVTSQPLPPLDHRHLVVDPYSNALVALSDDGNFTFCQLASPLPLVKSAETCVRDVRSFHAHVRVAKADFIYPTPGHPVLHLLVIGGIGGVYQAHVFTWELAAGDRWQCVRDHSIRLGTGTPSLPPAGNNADMVPDLDAPSILVPLANTPGAFLVGFVDWLVVYKNAHINETCQSFRTKNEQHRSSTPTRRNRGSTSKVRIWVGWARPTRWPKKSEWLYLCREDGIVQLIQVGTQMEFPGGDPLLPPVSPQIHQSSHAADLGGNISPAFALYDAEEGRLDAPRYGGDILLFMGQSCDGAHYEVHPQTGDGQPDPILDTKILDVFHNWSPFFDIAEVPDAAASASRNGYPSGHPPPFPPSRLFATSGQGHAGAVSELRYGCEIKLASTLSVEDLEHATDVWSIRCRSNNVDLCVVGQPYSTMVLVSFMAAPDDIGVLTSFDGPTVLFSSIIPQCTQEDDLGLSDLRFSDYFLRVSGSEVTLLQLVVDVEEDQLRPSLLHVESWKQSNIVAAASDGETGLVAIATTEGDGSKITMLRLDSNDGAFTLAPGNISCALASSVISIQLFKAPSEDQSTCIKPEDGRIARAKPSLVGVSTQDQELVILALGSALDLQRLHMASSVLPHQPETDTTGSATISALNAPCESFGFVPTKEGHGVLQVYCGLRNGRLVILRLKDESPDGRMVLLESQVVEVSQMPLRITVDQSSRPGVFVYSERVVLYDDGKCNRRSERLSSMYFTDRNDRGLSQPSVTALGQVDASDNKLVCITDLGLVVASYSRFAEPLPRSLPVPGSPHRVLWSAHAERLIVASTFNIIEKKKRFRMAGLTLLDPDEPDEVTSEDEGRQALQPSTLCLEGAGEIITAIAEWDCQVLDRRRRLVMVATSSEREDGRERGWLRMAEFFQREDGKPMLRFKKQTFREDDGSVWAMAVFDPLTLVYCVNNEIAMRRARQPADGSGLRLTKSTLGSTNSKGTYVSCQAPYVSVTTEESSTQVYHLDAENARLTLLGSDVQARDGVGNLLLHEYKLMLATGRDGSVIGLQYSDPSKDALVFDALLTKPIGRLISARLQASHRRGEGSEGESRQLLGTSPDGSLVQLSLLSEGKWRLLAFVQNLCLRDQRISLLPIYEAWHVHLSPDEGPQGRHIDGDLLHRLVQQLDPAQTLEEMLEAPIVPHTGATDFDTVEDRIHAFQALVAAWAGEEVSRNAMGGIVIDAVRDALRHPL